VNGDSAFWKRWTVRRSVYGRLVERYIFNFRISPTALDRHLPVAWLRPQVVNGFGAVSFCILKLEGLTLWPLPHILGVDTISCAYRCGVIDASKANSGPSVYIVSRNTDLPIISSAGPVLIRNAMPKVHTSILHKPRFVDINATCANGDNLFSAKVRSAKNPDDLDSKIFRSLDDFVKFIHDGSSSYARSISDESLARVDVQKDDLNYQAVDATIYNNSIESEWPDADMIFDSAFRAESGGIYKWTYLGLVPKHPGQLLQEIEVNR